MDKEAEKSRGEIHQIVSKGCRTCDYWDAENYHCMLNVPIHSAYPCRITDSIIELGYRKLSDRPTVCQDCPTFEQGCEGSNQEDCGRQDRPELREEALRIIKEADLEESPTEVWESNLRDKIHELYKKHYDAQLLRLSCHIATRSGQLAKLRNELEQKGVGKPDREKIAEIIENLGYDKYGCADQVLTELWNNEKDAAYDKVRVRL